MMNYITIKYEEWKEERQFQKKFPDKTFKAIDRALKRAYLWENPYRISRKFLEKRRDPIIHQYGETPLSSLYEIGRFAEVGREDHLIELGSGRGRASFFLHHFFGCKVTGIERIPVFVKRARAIAKRFSLNTSFIEGDFTGVSFETATVIYLYGTLLTDEEIKSLILCIPRGVRVVSTSYPLSDYDPSFTVLKKIGIRYPWGDTEAYLCYRC